MYTYRVFEIIEDTMENNTHYDLYFNSGDLIDSYRRICSAQEAKLEMSESAVISEEPLDQKNCTGKKYYRINDGFVHSAWYNTQELAETYYDLIDSKDPTNKVLEFGTLHSMVTKKCEFPIEAIFKIGPKGLHTNINLTPETDGMYSRGKFYFPNRKCKNVCAGPAIIHSVVDYGTYGFVDATMKQYTAPDRYDLFWFITDCHRFNITADSMIITEDTPFGTLLVVTSPKATFIPVMIDGICVNATELVDALKQINPAQVRVRSKTPVKEYFVNQSHQCSRESFSKKFVGCQFYFPDAIDDDDEEENELMQEVFPTLIIERKKLNRIVYYQIDHRDLWQLPGMFSTEEIDSLIPIINKANTEANDEIMHQLRTGKMRLTL